MKTFWPAPARSLNILRGFLFEQFLSDGKTTDAVIRNFEIIGEAANRLPEDVKDRFTSVDWFMLRGFRNRIVHDYMGINYEIVWDIRENFLQLLVEEIKNILAKF